MWENGCVLYTQIHFAQGTEALSDLGIHGDVFMEIEG